MKVWNELTYISQSSLALGFFDGLHLGHKVVLKNAINLAKMHKVESVAVVFKNHPLNILRGENIPLILTLEEKINLLENIGIDNVVLLNFNEFMHIKAIDYLENILIKYFSPIAITTGFNHSFGFNKEGTADFLAKNQKLFNYKYFEIPPFVVDSNIVSSSVIRNMLQLGDFYEANRLLGYNFSISGIVQKGDEIASGLGFPSANIEYPNNKIKIPYGVYFVIVEVDNKIYNGVLNYGNAPTMGEKTAIKTEVFILDFNENIYSKKIKISFVAKIRNQMKFDNLDKLKFQIKRDIGFVDIYKYFINSKTSFSFERHLL